MDADRKKKLIACLMLMINVVGVLATVDNGDLIQEMVCGSWSCTACSRYCEIGRKHYSVLGIVLVYQMPILQHHAVNPAAVPPSLNHATHSP